MTLRATTCLGGNTVPILSDLVSELVDAGVDIAFDEFQDPGAREAAFRAGAVDLAWACGLLTAETIDGLDLEVVAAPVFDGESGPVYRSVIVVSASSSAATVSDTFGGRLALNEYGSWSGYRGFERWLESVSLSIDAYRTHVLTGSHRNSARALADGVADVAAIDHTVWNHLVATEPWVSDLRVIATTSDSPAPPFSLRSGLVADLAPVLLALHPAGLVRIEPAAIESYRPMLPGV